MNTQNINENVTKNISKGNNSTDTISIIIIVIIIILVLALIGVMFFYKEQNDDISNNTNDNSIISNNSNNINDNSSIDDNSNNTIDNSNTNNDVTKKEEHELIVYKYDDGRLSAFNDGIEAFKIKVSTNNAKVLAVDSKESLFVLYNDNGLYIYNVKNKTKEKVNLENNYKEYIIFMNENENKIIGIAYVDSNNYIGYYNVAKNIKLYNKKYKKSELGFSFDRVIINQINDNYLSLCMEGEAAYLLSSNRDEVILSHKIPNGDSEVYFYECVGKTNDCIYILNILGDDVEPLKIYDSSFNEIPRNNYLYNFYNNKLYLYGTNTIKIYNTKGELLSTIDKYKDIKDIINNYVIYIDNNNLFIENIDDTNESKKLASWDKNYVYGYDSGFYDRTTLDRMQEENKKEGLYVVIEYPNKDKNGNYGMEYCYTNDKQIIEYPIKEEIGGRAKPVLYLYPENETNVKVTFSNPEFLTTTYPKYNSSWNVKALPNGDLYDKDGKYYYALYWDEKRYNEVDFHEGFYVEDKDAINFLEEKLSIIGLSDKERNEFIMYWLPIMEKNGKNLVYFELTKEREKTNKLIIEPKPDSLLRVSIHIKKVNRKTNIKEQKLESFKRNGFTAVEWGGMTY